MRTLRTEDLCHRILRKLSPDKSHKNQDQKLSITKTEYDCQKCQRPYNISKREPVQLSCCYQTVCRECWATQFSGGEPLGAVTNQQAARGRSLSPIESLNKVQVSSLFNQTQFECPYYCGYDNIEKLLAPKVNLKIRRKVEKLMNPNTNPNSGIVSCDYHADNYSIAYS